MERTIIVNGTIHNTDKWCEENLETDTPIGDALKKYIDNCQELKQFKSQLRSNIKHWQDDKKYGKYIDPDYE